MLTGTVAQPPEHRRTPAGLTIGRFLLEHDSGSQGPQDGGLTRFRIRVRVTDESLLAVVKQLHAGAPVTVMGNLCMADHRAHRQTFEIHARRLYLNQQQTD